LLVPSEISGRQALPDYTLRCNLSGKRILMDEAELSAVSGNPVASCLLKTCPVTGKRAEPEHFERCDFTGAEVLNNTQLAVSEVSGKRYRLDQQLRSAVSGKAGHKEEFLFCHETRQPMIPQEAETCEATGKFVRPGVLERCGLTGKAVLPSELERCAVSDKRVLKRLLVTSSVSAARLQHQLAVRSIYGKYCAPTEAATCMWSGRRSHPDDMRFCTLTGIPFHVEFAAAGGKPYLQPLTDLLHGVRRTADAADRWEDIAAKASTALRGSRCRVETAHVSPDKRHLAICSEVRTMLGFRVHQAGMLYSMEDGSTGENRARLHERLFIIVPQILAREPGEVVKDLLALNIPNEAAPSRRPIETLKNVDIERDLNGVMPLRFAVVLIVPTVLAPAGFDVTWHIAASLFPQQVRHAEQIVGADSAAIDERLAARHGF
jgi:hypothetical protein